VRLVLEPFDLPFVQRGLLEVGVLAIGAGLVGTWIVLRGLAFYSHAVGTAAFPGLVLADGLGFSAHLGAAATAAVVAAGVGWLARRDRDRYDSSTALVLVAALAVGVILASDVFHSGADVENLLFGSLLVIGPSDVLWAAGAGVAVIAGTLLLGHRWTAAGFDPTSARALGVRSALPDAALLALVALVAIAALSAIGALLATALLVVPAATTRLLFSRLRPWQLASVVLAALEGAVGLWISVEANAPPGAAIAVLSAAVFVLVAGGRALLAARRAAAPAAAAAAAAAVLALALLVAGCGASGSADDGRLSVVATTTQLGDLVRNVGGHAVDVTQILRPNTDPHEYEPRPSDVLDTAGAKVVFENGDGLDGWMAKVLDEAGGSPTVVDLGAHVPDRLPGEASGPEASRYDPHWWHDPRDVEAAVGAIRDALSRADPAQKARFARNAAAYLARVRRLDAGIRACLATVPPAQRKLVTDHDAFGYFARRYGVQVIGAVIPSQTTQAQPSAGDIAKLSALIQREGVKAVFPETSINQKLAQALARQTGATAHYDLYGDTLGPAGSPGATYLGMERANANAMVRGFTGGRQGCTSPGL
jgi:ABC-type Zn uptake system ZnuABC Zn-binding protein ZnuA/ABC-type Mn2+/Zn2+ transport system permease subunit